MGLPRSMFYYQKTKDDSAVIAALQKLAEDLPTAGFPEYRGRIRKEHLWNHKRIRRVYKKMGLNIRRKHKRRLPERVKQPLEQQLMPNAIWSMDFMQDSLVSGRKFRTFNVIDDFNREGLAIEVSTSFPGEQVVRVLQSLIQFHGKPNKIRSDNGPEFISDVVKKFMKENDIEHHFIQPGKPTQNAYIERFNRTFRTAVLNAYLFEDLSQVRVLAEKWINDYNDNHPHSSLNGLSPVEYKNDVNSGKLTPRTNTSAQFTTINIDDDHE